MNQGVKRKLWLAVAVLGLVAFLGGQLYMVQTAPPENKARLASWVRESPAWQFYGLMGLASIPFLITLYIVVNQKRWSRMATSGSIRNAKKIALSLWLVDGQPMLNEGFAVVRFRHMSFGRWRFILPVRSGHPDIEHFRRLQEGDTVEFEPLSEGMDCALEHELCGYLRIKSVS